MGGFDLVVPVWTMGTITNEQEAGLLEAVKAGWMWPAGMAAWPTRSATTPSTSSWSAAVGGPSRQHHRLHRQHPHRDDPIMAGLTTSRCTRSSTTCTSILERGAGDHDLHRRACPWIAGTVMPVVWKRRYGKARVFYCSLGHVACDFDTPEARVLVERGMLWAAGFWANRHTRSVGKPAARPLHAGANS